MYDLGKKLKQYGNPAQMFIKLLMKSMYGKSISKPVETDTIAKDSGNDFGKYSSYNYNYIGSVLEVNCNSYLKKGFINLISS